jgi:hypothetical protein
MVATLLAMFACAEEENRPPRLQPMDDQVFKINQANTLNVASSDPDGDPRTYTRHIDPPVEGPTLTKVTEGLALFQWTPGISALNGERSKVYRVTFTVEDDRGGKHSETIGVTVVDDGVGGSSALRFVEPVGAGMAVGTPCITDLPVQIRAESVASEDVVVELVEPLVEGASLSPGSNVPGKNRLFNWCPTAAQLDRSLSHSVAFAAREVGSDEPVVKRFLFRFKRAAGAGCAGDAPVINHTSAGTFSGPLNYDVQATITDDVGFKAPPVLAFVVNPEIDPRGAGSPDISGWQIVPFEPDLGDTWVASVPNLGLADGASAQVYYQIIATDNDDAEGSGCDHTTESAVFRFIARGGGASAGQTYGFCEPCVTDAQCGGEKDRCVSLRGESFCGTSCEGGASCAAGAQCLVFDSVDGVATNQCVPADLNCGQICVADAFDAAAPNNTWETATSIQPGTHEALTICAGDVDYYRVPIGAQQSISVQARFADGVGDLDLLMVMPGDDPENPAYRSFSEGSDVEAVNEPCAAMAGEAVVLVFPFEDAQNTYTLEVTTGPGDCNQMCVDDAYDAGQGNDTFDNFAAVDLPFYEDNLTICREDADFYAFDAVAGDVLDVSLLFPQADGDLDLFLYNSVGPVAQSEGYQDIELIEYQVPATDIYVVEVYGATRSVANDYALEIRIVDVQMCQSSMSCPAGSYCTEAGCVDAICNSFDQCGPGHGCVTPRAGLDPGSVGGACAAACQNDQGCRQDSGYRCKKFEDFTQACAVAGGGATGDRCNSYEDCGADRVCFPVPGGYCATGGCDVGGCAEGTFCAALTGFQGCLKACENDGDCRAQDGHRCVDLGNGRRGCQP